MYIVLFLHGHIHSICCKNLLMSLSVVLSYSLHSKWKGVTVFFCVYRHTSMAPTRTWYSWTFVTHFLNTYYTVYKINLFASSLFVSGNLLLSVFSHVHVSVPTKAPALYPPLPATGPGQWNGPPPSPVSMHYKPAFQKVDKFDLVWCALTALDQKLLVGASFHTRQLFLHFCFPWPSRLPVCLPQYLLIKRLIVSLWRVLTQPTHLRTLPTVLLVQLWSPLPSLHSGTAHHPASTLLDPELQWYGPSLSDRNSLVGCWSQ